jgi:hypothetical protein
MCAPDGITVVFSAMFNPHHELLDFNTFHLYIYHAYYLFAFFPGAYRFCPASCCVKWWFPQRFREASCTIMACQTEIMQVAVGKNIVCTFAHIYHQLKENKATK